MHDNHYGAVNHLCTSYDDKFVVSGGADGNVFIYEADLPSTKEKRESVKKLRSIVALKVGKPNVWGECVAHVPPAPFISLYPL